MATFVLVPGGGHGGWCYGRVARLLEAAGHTTYCPTLTGLGERSHLLSAEVDLDMHLTDLAEVLSYEDLSDVVLVGHSYGGMIIKGVADRAGGRVGKLVFLDALPIRGGQRVLDAYPHVLKAREVGRVIDGVEVILLPSADLPAKFGVTDPDDARWMVERLTPHPWRSLDQPLVLDDEDGVDAIPQFQVVTSGTLEMMDPVEIDRARDAGRFWELDTGHDLMVTAPAPVADILTQIAAA